MSNDGEMRHHNGGLGLAMFHGEEKEEDEEGDNKVEQDPDVDQFDVSGGRKGPRYSQVEGVHYQHTGDRYRNTCLEVFRLEVNSAEGDGEDTEGGEEGGAEMLEKHPLEGDLHPDSVLVVLDEREVPHLVLHQSRTPEELESSRLEVDDMLQGVEVADDDVAFLSVERIPTIEEFALEWG